MNKDYAFEFWNSIDRFNIYCLTANLKTNTSAFIVSWCRYFNDTSRMRNLVTEIDVDPSDGFHNYKVEFAVKNEEATSVSMLS